MFYLVTMNIEIFYSSKLLFYAVGVMLKPKIPMAMKPVSCLDEAEGPPERLYVVLLLLTSITLHCSYVCCLSEGFCLYSPMYGCPACIQSLSLPVNFPKSQLKALSWLLTKIRYKEYSCLIYLMYVSQIFPFPFFFFFLIAFLSSLHLFMDLFIQNILF